MSAQKTMAKAYPEHELTFMSVVFYVIAVVISIATIWMWLESPPMNFAAETDAMQAAQRAARLDSAKRDICGPEAFWRDINEHDFQCLDKKGRKTLKRTL